MENNRITKYVDFLNCGEYYNKKYNLKIETENNIDIEKEFIIECIKTQILGENKSKEEIIKDIFNKNGLLQDFISIENKSIEEILKPEFKSLYDSVKDMDVINFKKIEDVKIKRIKYEGLEIEILNNLNKIYLIEVDRNEIDRVINKYIENLIIYLYFTYSKSYLIILNRIIYKDNKIEIKEEVFKMEDIKKIISFFDIYKNNFINNIYNYNFYFCKYCNYKDLCKGGIK